eukprot:TRINITY_DN3711_c0_g1_i1.p1 TRINITY_DN3711_c0_g1~~TRINITY_DN3711_c0_g1_i1.p1  ORF type:complete len:1354 (-),score=436.63 TRINITY_DN3711_c0_g1_i1:102-4106(-)
MAQNSMRPLSATAVATYHLNNCELYLQFRSNLRSPLHKIPNKDTENAYKDAILNKGNDWEKNLVKKLEAKGEILDLTSNSSAFLEETVKRVKSSPLPCHFYVYGTVFEGPKLKENLDVKFSIWKPDLIEIKGEFNEEEKIHVIHIKIIDAKASDKVKVTHQVQTGYYWLSMQEVLDGKRAEFSAQSVRFVLEDPLGVWLLDEEDPHWFSMELLKPLLITFLFEKLPKILKKEDPYWHFNPICQGCEYLDECKSNTEEKKTLSSIPHLSFRDHKLLKNVIARGNNQGQITEIEELCKVARNEDETKEMKGREPITLQRIKKILRVDLEEKMSNSPVLKAAHQGSVQLIQKACSLLPRAEQHSVYLTVVCDPGTQKLCAYHITRRGESKEKIAYCASSFGSEEEEKLVFVNFTKDLARFLKELEGKNVQIYVFGHQERKQVVQLLINGFLEQSQQDESLIRDIGTCLLTLSNDADILQINSMLPKQLSAVSHSTPTKKKDMQDFIKQNDPRRDLSPLKNNDELKKVVKEIEVEMKKSAFNNGTERLTVMHQVVSHFFAMPVAGFFDLDSCIRLLLPSEFHGHSETSEENLYSLWRSNEDKELEEGMSFRNRSMIALCQEIRKRLNASDEKTLSDLLPLNATELSLQKLELDDLLLKKMYFMRQYELLLSLNSLRGERFEGTGRTVLLEFMAKVKITIETDEVWFNRFKIVRGGEYIEGESVDRKGNKQGFPSYKWILFPEETLPQILFNDLRILNKLPMTFKKEDSEEFTERSGFCIANVTDQMEEDGKVLIQLKGASGLVQGRRYVLRERLVDWNTKKVCENLQLLDKKGDSVFVKMIRDPRYRSFEKDQKSLNQNLKVIEKVFSDYANLSDDPGVKRVVLSRAQSKAMKSMALNPFTIVWGPPGNGKTHTLAMLSLRLLEHKIRVGKPFRMLMTAFTHMAIGEFMNKLKQLKKEILGEEHLNVPEVRTKLEQLKLFQNDQLPTEEDELFVFGGTVWSLWKNRAKLEKFEFDLVLIDEGSQLPLVDSSIATGFVSSETRFVIAGDRLQLPPILKGQYPTSKPNIYGSVLDCFQQSEGANQDNVVLLNENYRMHPSLARFTQNIYGVEFKAKKMKRVILWKPNEGEGSIAKCLNQLYLNYKDKKTDEENRLVTFQIKAPEESESISIESHLECEAMMVIELLDGIQKWKILNPSEETDACDVFVITPHRIQRTCIKNKMANKQLNLRVRVDTVEKMQGGEAPVVICCYGFTNLSTVENELDFVFHRNRLNVALSRAKELCILLASDHIIDPPISVLSSAERCEAFAHLRKFRNESLRFPVELKIDQVEGRKTLRMK